MIDWEEMNLDSLPPALAPGIKRYIEHGIQPGGFLTAVICNDLLNTVGRASVENFTSLPSILRWFYNDAPGDCWGSEAKMRVWIKNKELDLNVKQA